MREALARSDHDFVVSEPSRTRSGGRRAKARNERRWLGALTRRPFRLFLSAALGALVTGIIANALLFQTARHPAPLFIPQPPKPAVAAPAAPPASAMPVPEPTPKPADILTPAAVPMMPSVPLPPAAPLERSRAPARVPVPPMAVKPKDPIAALLRGDAEPPQARPAETADPKSVAAAQRALIKLEFVVRTDGTMDSPTRLALQYFERDHGLPSTGELSPKVLRELQAP